MNPDIPEVAGRRQVPRKRLQQKQQSARGAGTEDERKEQEAGMPRICRYGRYRPLTDWAIYQARPLYLASHIDSQFSLVITMATE